MFHPLISSTRAWAAALALWATSPVWAQPVVPAYQSTFDGYRGFADQPVGGWAAANRDAADIGGWRAYAKAARAPAGNGAEAPAESSSAAPTVKHGTGHRTGPSSDLPHAGHAAHAPGQAGARP